MTMIPTRRLRVSHLGAALALILTLAPTVASAGWPFGLFARNHKPYRNADGRIRAEHTPNFGPPMIYSRDYADAYPFDVVRDQPFTPDHRLNPAIR